MSMMGKSAKMSSTSSRFCCLSVDFIPYMQQETLPAVLGVHIYHTLIIAAMLPLQAGSPPTDTVIAFTWSQWRHMSP